MIGLSDVESVNILLNFVQTAFEYQTDNEQFGYERPLFGAESFFYPYNDCEDRSILFSILVREIIGLDVVLLHYLIILQQLFISMVMLMVIML